MFLSSIESIAVLDVIVDAAVAIAGEVTGITFNTIHFTYSEAVGYLCPVAQPTRE